MTTPPEDFPRDALTDAAHPEADAPPDSSSNLAPEAFIGTSAPNGSTEVLGHDDIPALDEPLFRHYEYTPPLPPPRKPNFGDLVVFLLLALAGLWVSSLIIAKALHYRLFGVSNLDQAQNEIHYKLGSQAAWYLITLLLAAILFPLLWRIEAWAHAQYKLQPNGIGGLFRGIHWRASSAVRHVWRLLGAAGACFVVAIADEVLIPGPPNTPIDQTFHMPGAIWLLFGFGVTLAPLIEEITYRGFLLPSLCTAWDWAMEQMGFRQRSDTGSGECWSLPAMIVASIVTSIPFALMHGEQTAWSIGPFLLLVAISLVLCWIRLATRSLAASVLVHSSYNLLLFSLMFLGTGGFKHLDRM